ncbi:MAG: 4-alpha-glucanotransferase, partial [Pseudomonadota bacterium]
MTGAGDIHDPDPPGGPLTRRRAGILLHPTSLPAARIQGGLGHDAYRFVEFLAAGGITVWQMLPLGPTHPDGSPYQCLSAHAGSPQLISLDWLIDRGWLTDEEDADCADDRPRCLKRAHQGFVAACMEADSEAATRYAAFVEAQRYWLDDFALFTALRETHHGAPWYDWPANVRGRKPAALKSARAKHAARLEQVFFEQFVFFEQWHELRDYAHRHGVLLFGDMPIFVAHDSADVWAQPENFALDDTGHPLAIAGVPPDYFSETGQRWGNPHYD